jgi:hypothetical protein
VYIFFLLLPKLAIREYITLSLWANARFQWAVDWVSSGDATLGVYIERPSSAQSPSG